jgi:hypothetical protein
VGARKITLFPADKQAAIFKDETVVFPAPVGSTKTADTPG